MSYDVDIEGYASINVSSNYGKLFRVIGGSQVSDEGLRSLHGKTAKEAAAWAWAGMIELSEGTVYEDNVNQGNDSNSIEQVAGFLGWLVWAGDRFPTKIAKVYG